MQNVEMVRKMIESLLLAVLVVLIIIALQLIAIDFKLGKLND